MNKITQISSKIKVFSDSYFKNRDYFVCIYGSFATKNNTSASDLDVIFIVKDLMATDFKIIKNFTIDIHREFNLKIDEEVPYKNKLLITFDEIKNISKLKPFHISNRNYFIPKIILTKKYLSSGEVRQRFLLNIFTTPTLFISGNKSKHTESKLIANKSIIMLARYLLKKENPSNSEIFDILVYKNKLNNIGSDLGYKTDRPQVLEYLQKIIKNTK